MANRPGFFKFYIPSLGEENRKIPPRFVQSVQETWQMNLTLRDRYNNLWNVKVEMVGGDWYFREGWTKFVDDNKIKGGDMVVYEYFSQGLLDFKVHGRSACLTEGVGGRKTENSEEQIITIESDDDVVDHTDEIDYDPIDEGENSRDDYYQIDKVMDDDTDDYDSSTKEENQQDDHFQVKQATDDGLSINISRMIGSATDTYDDRSVPATEEEDNQIVDPFEAEEMTDDDTADWDYLPTTEEANQQDACPVEKEAMSVSKCVQMTPQEVPKDDNSQRKVVEDGTASSSRRRDCDWFGADIFKTGLVPYPQNPYFVTKIRRNRPGELYLPMEVLKSYKLQLPETVTFLDPQGRQFLGRLKVWSDERTFYFGGWKSLCRVNMVGEDDTCICEFVGNGDDMSIRVSFFPPK